MAAKQYHLIHANLANLRAPLSDPSMTGYGDQLEKIDSQAERFAGFISQPELPDAGKVFNGDMLLYVSVWEEVEMLERFVNNSRHAELHSRPEEWFISDEYPPYVLFWLPAEEKVTEQEVKDRFALLDEKGPTTSAFTFERRFTVTAMLTAELKQIPRNSLV